MALRDYMPWGRRADDASALRNVRGLVASMGRALEEPWELTSARLLGSEWTPRLELSETPRDIIVALHLPDVKKEDIHLSATADSLSIRGLKRGENGQGQGERFYRSLALPATVRPDEIVAGLKDGVLTVTLPKAKHSQVRRITIH